jgi:uncharacterized protein
MLLVVERAEAGGRSGWGTHWRRMLVLFGFGAIHYFLIWKGDILTLYAVCGIIVFLFRKCQPRTLVLWGGLFILLSMAMMFAISTSFYHNDIAAHSANATARQIREWNQSGGYFYPSQARIARDIAEHQGSWLSLTMLTIKGWGEFVGNLIGGSVETVGLMLIGMAGYKSGLLTGRWSAIEYRRLALWGIALGLLAHGVLVAVDIQSRFYSPYLMGGFMGAMAPFRIVQALGYAALLALFVMHGGMLVDRLAAVGRAAFTNYLGTSILTTFVFYGWGLGLYGSLSRAESWLLMVPLVWIIMLVWSKPWLDHYRYGPLEWAWRTLARGRLQPMRRPQLTVAPA